MKERPILFSGPMVRAILEGRKTQTRRVVKPQPQMLELSGRLWWETPKGRMVHSASREWHEYLHDQDKPYAPGDRLWVRETWHPAARLGAEYLIEYKADESERTVDAGFEGPTPTIDAAISRNAWRPSIHMPRWASRLTLEVTGVRVERLQDITPDDARAEGHPHTPGTERYPQDVHDEAARDWFMDLWDDINAKRGHTWVSNPWVWVVEFNRLEEKQVTA